MESKFFLLVDTAALYVLNIELYGDEHTQRRREEANYTYLWPWKEPSNRQSIHKLTFSGLID